MQNPNIALKISNFDIFQKKVRFYDNVICGRRVERDSNINRFARSTDDITIYLNVYNVTSKINIRWFDEILLQLDQHTTDIFDLQSSTSDFYNAQDELKL